MPTLGCSHWHTPSLEWEDCDRSQRWEDDSHRQHNRKGKGQASYQDLEDQHEIEKILHHQDEARVDEQCIKHACIHTDHMLIPQHVVDMQMGDYKEHRPNLVIKALWDQISQNVELARQCNELKKMLNKQQLSLKGRYGQTPKCY